MIVTILLLALPAGASADYTLEIFGNANGDETINMQDVTYTELIILEYQDATELADAKYDGEIDILDVTQIELIILGTEKEITLIDSTERIVTVEKPVGRIVFTHHANAEGILILRASDRVVGREYNIPTIELFPELMELPSINGMGHYDVDYEKVFELEPDIFLTTDLPIPGLEDLIATLEPEIPVVAIDFFDPHTMVENVRKLRYILNTKEEGDAFIAFYEDVINDITKETAGLTDEEKPQVFMKTPGWTPEQICTFNDEMSLAVYLFEMSGAINIAADLPGPGGWVPELDPEWLAEQNPDAVVAQIWPVYYPGSLGYEIDDDSVAIATREQIMEMDAFAGSDAVLNDRVYLYHCDFMTTPRCVIGIAYWAKWFHPDLFSDLDPQAIHQQYLTDFLGIDHDLDEHGVFVYPEP